MICSLQGQWHHLADQWPGRRDQSKGKIWLGCKSTEKKKINFKKIIHHGILQKLG